MSYQESLKAKLADDFRPMFCRPFYGLEKHLLSSKCLALMKVREELNKSVNGSDIASATSLRTLLLIWSEPHAFLVSNAFNIIQTSSV